MPVNKVRRNGSYAPLSAHYYKDDAIDEAGLDAELLYVRGLAFCADVLSDGFISDRQLVRFVGIGMTDAVDRAKRLVEAGLWERVDGGYTVRSWLDWNRSRAEITDYQAKDAARKSRSGGVRQDSKPPEPDPPTGASGPSERNPNGIPADSEPPSDRSPHGLQPRARTPRNSTPRNSKTGKNLSSATPPREDIDRLCTHLANRIETNTGRRPTITNRWRDSARLLLDKDLTAESDPLALAVRLADWATNDEFWRTNVLSMPTFRDKFDQLRLKARREWEQANHRRPTYRTSEAVASVDVAFDEWEARHPLGGNVLALPTAHPEIGA